MTGSVVGSAPSTPRQSFDSLNDRDSIAETPPFGARPSARKRGASLLGRWFGGSKESLPDMTEAGTNKTAARFQDKLLTMLLEQIVPKDGEPDREPSGRSGLSLDRPNFSLPTMSHNFRRFNARIGVVFIFQTEVLRMLAWKNPTQTATVLAVYTLLCLNPKLLPVFPLVLCVLFVMVPAFLARHSPDSPESELTSPTEYVNSLAGPPVAPATKIKPVAELSKDFFRNMRDLQNVMEDFSRGYDMVVNHIAPPLNFSDESVSTALFALSLGAIVVVYCFAHLIPWQPIMLVLGWVVICAGSPHVQVAMQMVVQTVALAIHTSRNEAKDLSETGGWDEYEDEVMDEPQDDVVPRLKERLEGFLDPDKVNVLVRNLARADIDLSGGPEKRQVEIFELQYRALPSSLLGSKARRDRSMSPPHSPSAVTTIPTSLMGLGNQPYLPSFRPEAISRRTMRRRRSTSRHRPGTGSTYRPDTRNSSVESGRGTATITVTEAFLSKPYESYIFSPFPFIPLSPARIAGQMPQGCRRFEDVQPPGGWEWADKKWVLDLDSNGWVGDRCVTNVEVEVEGERWVWDVILPETTTPTAASSGATGRRQNRRRRASRSANGGAVVVPAVTEAPSTELDTTGPTRGRTGGSDREHNHDHGDDHENQARPIRGEWRRRRWIRWVKRCVADAMDDANDWANAATGGGDLSGNYDSREAGTLTAAATAMMANAGNKDGSTAGGKAGDHVVNRRPFDQDELD